MAASITLKAYADESGIHDGAERCVVAGYFASPYKWSRFSEAWSDCLSEAWPVFHAKEFFGRDGRPLTIEDAERLLDSLLGVIERHDIYPFAGEVIMEDWAALSYGERKYLTGAHKPKGKLHGGAPDTPYHLCFVHALNVVASRVRAGKTVEFLFDRQKQYGPLALENFSLAEEWLRKEQSKFLAGCSFWPKDDLPPLQAADLLAHCIYNRKRDVNTWRRRALTACAKGGFKIEVYNTRSFEIILNRFLKPGEREYLRSEKRPRQPSRRGPR